MNKTEWENLIKQQFDFLFLNYGFKIKLNEYFEKFFGNRKTILENEKYIIIIEWDRDRLSINITSKAHKEFIGYLGSILGYINNNAPSFYNRYNLDALGQVEYMARLFKERKIEIFNFFEKGNWKETNEKFLKYIEKSASEVTWEDFQ